MVSYEPGCPLPRKDKPVDAATPPYPASPDHPGNGANWKFSPVSSPCRKNARKLSRIWHTSTEELPPTPENPGAGDGRIARLTNSSTH